MTTAAMIGSTKAAVLKVLFEQATAGRNDPSLTISGICQKLPDRLGGALAQIFLDELIDQGLVTRGAGGPRERFRITSLGIQFVDNIAQLDVSSGSIESNAWTGRSQDFALSETRQREIVVKIKQLKKVIEQAPLTNSERSQAIALVTSALVLAEAPDPPWKVVKETLTWIAAISTTLSLALQVAALIY